MRFSVATQILLEVGLDSEKVPFNTYSRKDERNFKAVFFGLPVYAKTQLKDELISLGFNDPVVGKI